ncbi:MAG TPA: hypothetical protein VHK67_03030 [Rhabdochlamydiaceae bacterium]|jgi:hypothetical protein|nr:hypothetical protein [Rhabdochlamydiaceae bacterium]
MRKENLLFSAVQFFLVLVLACTGLFFIALPWAPHVRFTCAAFLAQRDDLFMPLGGLILGVATILGVGFYFMQRKAYFQVRMSPAVHVERALLKTLLAAYWKERYPEEKLKTDVVLHRDQRLEFIAELPHLKFADPEKLVSEVQLEVGKLMLHQFGYKRDFIFTFELR